jgi:hypothetical protein
MRFAQVVMIIVAGLMTMPSFGFANDAELEKLKQQIELLETKLRLAEQTAEILKKECADLRNENARLKGMDSKGKSDKPDEGDQFRVGAVWVGVSKSTNDPQRVTRWAISVSERDGEKLSGGLAIVNPDGKKADVPFSGKAPATGDGLVVIETPAIGRAKILARGRLVNGVASLVFSGTNPLGEKIFGAAAMKPE